MTLEFHPFADLFPLIEGREFDELVADIREHGLRERIVIHEGKILDGRNRYRAGIAAGIIEADAPAHNGIGMQQWCQLYLPGYEGDPLKWVLSKNLHRRHMSPSQLSMLAADLGKLPAGRPSEWRGENSANLQSLSHVEQPAPVETPAEPQLSASERASLVGVSTRQVSTADFVKEHAAPVVVAAVRKGEVAVAAAAEVARLPIDQQEDLLRHVDAKALGRVAKERLGKPGGGLAVAHDRKEPADSLNFFPTGPWATRTLVVDVLQVRLGVELAQCSIVDPACGEGHMTGVLEEYADDVRGYDIFDYSAEGRSAPCWRGVRDFTDETVEADAADWYISNPPFADDITIAFIKRSLQLARRGVAMLVRTGWATEGIGRYEAIFRDTPPTLYAFFVERCPLHKGQWLPDGDTMTAYCWLVWLKDDSVDFDALLGPRAPFHIPPGRRKERTKQGDVERFTAHPVLPRNGDSQTGVDGNSPAGDAHPSQPAVAASAADAGGGGQSRPPASTEPETEGQGTSPVVGELARSSTTGAGETGSASSPAAFRSTPNTDAIIRAAYAGAGPVDFGALTRQLGCTKLQARRRASQLGLGSRDRQLGAILALEHGEDGKFIKPGAPA